MYTKGEKMTDFDVVRIVKVNPAPLSPSATVSLVQVDIILGGNGQRGSVYLSEPSAKHEDTAQIAGLLDAGKGLWHGGRGANGQVVLFPGSTAYTGTFKDSATTFLDGGHGNLWLGANGQSGNIIMFPPKADSINDQDQAQIKLNGETASISVSWPAPDSIVPDESILMSAKESKITIKNVTDSDPNVGLFPSIGLNASSGEFGVRDGKGIDVIRYRASSRDMRIGPATDPAPIFGGAPLPPGGRLRLRNARAVQTVVLAGGNIVTDSGGANNPIGGSLSLSNFTGTQTIFLNGETGQISTPNADCAEEFDVSSSESVEVEPGTVMVMSDDGKLKTSSMPYDKRVVGVVSGAGDFKPAVILDKKASQDKRVPVAVVGKVYCKVDADESSINIGDILTTSSIPGRAMKAINHSKSFGAVIGKALSGVNSGKTLIPLLIALQ
jgi:hypothetical protein